MSRPITFNKALGTSRVAPSRPVATQQFVPGTSDEERSRQLAEMQRTLQAVTDAATATTPPKFVELALVAGQDTTILRHALGRRARWSCVDWRPTTPGDPQAFTTVVHTDEANTLVLRASYSGTAEFEVR